MLNFTKHISVKIAEESIKETILISKLDVECEDDEEEMLKSSKLVGNKALTRKDLVCVLVMELIETS